MESITNALTEMAALVDARRKELARLWECKQEIMRKAQAAQDMAEIFYAAGKKAEIEETRRLLDDLKAANAKINERGKRLEREPIVTEAEYEKLCRPIADELLAMYASGTPTAEICRAAQTAREKIREIRRYLIIEPKQALTWVTSSAIAEEVELLEWQDQEAHKRAQKTNKQLEGG